MVFTNGAAAVHGHPNRTACAPPTPTTCAKSGDSAMADAVAARAQAMDLPCTRRAFAFYFYTVDDWEHRRPRMTLPWRVVSRKDQVGPPRQHRLIWRDSAVEARARPRRGGDGAVAAARPAGARLRARHWRRPATDGASNAFFFPQPSCFPAGRSGEDSCQCISRRVAACAWCANMMCHGRIIFGT